MNKILALVLILIATNVQAEWSFVKKAGVGRVDMDIVDFQPFAGGTFKTVRKVSFSSLNLSLTGFKDKLYASVNTELPFSDKSYDFSGQGGETVRTLAREDFGVTVGYNVYPGANLFMGYSYGENRFLNDSFTTPGTVDKVKETDSGPFLGANYSKEIENYGSLSLTLAYALLDGEIKSNDLTQTGIFTNNTGDTTGFSFALTYSNKYDEDSNYFVSVKVKNYEYNNVSSGSTAVDIVKEKNFFLVSVGLNIF